MQGETHQRVKAVGERRGPGGGARPDRRQFGVRQHAQLPLMSQGNEAP